MNIFIDLVIQSVTPPAIYFLSDHLQEQECDVYSHGDAWDGRVMAPGHAPSLLSSDFVTCLRDFVTLHVWRHCAGWAARSTLTHVLASRPPHRD